jgi:hypothetical protein
MFQYINMTPEFSIFISVFLFGIFITYLLWFLYMKCVEIYRLSRELRILHQNLVGRMENDSHDLLLETNENHSEV